MLLRSLALLTAVLATLAPPGWPERVQAPHRDLSLPDLGLQPLLRNAGGQPITDIGGLRKQQETLKKQWLSKIGAAPARAAALDPKTETVEREPDHIRQLVTFGSEGDDRIRAYLLIPLGLKAKEARPAVVVFHQTTKDTLKEPVGLGSKPELALALHLVRRGYVTLSPECYIMKGGGPRAQAAALEERRPGWRGLGKMVYDASRCIDFLETLPEVDQDRIGCIGHSLGAKEVLYAMALEPRYKVGVFSEGGIGLRMSNWADPWYLTQAIKPDIPAMEHHQLLFLIAPRPFLLVAGNSADNDSSWAFLKAVHPAYELLGAGDAYGMHNHKQGHSYPPAARELSYEWLDHWLKWQPKR